jgi:2-polyprenyl-6-hydroxyphenyl methylase/3-demethylubiquinone-9 3-methyltransferase
MSQTTITPQDAVDALKAQHRATWADGDYPAVAEHIAEALPQAALAQIDVAGAHLLDVATGSGNLALEAARAGATVTGVDLVPELIEAARRRATSAGVDIEWLVGDAEALPLPDDAFDATTSIVGVQFAPRSRVVADELIRVTRPGGTIVLVNWTPGGLIGQLFKTMSRHMPPPPDWVTPPPVWGSDDHLRELFSRAGEVTLTYGFNPFVFPSIDEYMRFFEVNHGPSKRAREKLEAEGRYAALEADLRELYTRLNQADDGTLHIDAEFVVCTVRLS